jgi:tRNA U34 5-methylaminomethyl-2-thiouridine-forming methyltransferase MnmC
MAIKLIVTSDGSHSLLNEDLGETYHSRHGAVQESLHVFIKNGLDMVAADPVNVFEVGFGTGLNALLTAQTGRTVNYTSIEAYPLGEEIYSELNYNPKELVLSLHRAPWNEPVNVDTHFTLTKIRGDVSFVPISGKYDIIYFDAFAPSKQPSMWELPVLKKVCDVLKPGGLFVTYCAKGQLKRDLKSLGLEVDTLTGPPGKKEMVRGRVKREEGRGER